MNQDTNIYAHKRLKIVHTDEYPHKYMMLYNTSGTVVIKKERKKEKWSRRQPQQQRKKNVKEKDNDKGG